ncbi:MAG TPA: FHA domain-containing protein [Polyangiaceae bacterium]
MPTVNELAGELRRKGYERLFEDYPASSVLIGVGILGIPALRAERSTRGTIRFTPDAQQEYVTAASLAGRVWFLTKKRENRHQSRIVIGRTSDADVTIPELSISVEHAGLQATPFGLAVVDLGSTNGTFVDGERVTKGVSVSLYSGMKLALARFEFEYLRHKDFLERLKQIAMRPVPHHR